MALPDLSWQFGTTGRTYVWTPWLYVPVFGLVTCFSLYGLGTELYNLSKR